MKFKDGLVAYQYRTGLNPNEVERYYQEKIFKPRWHPENGNYQCDIEDFKKFFAEVTHDNPLGSGEVREIVLITDRGCWHWYQGRGWVQFANEHDKNP